MSHIDYLRFRHGESCVEDGCRARKFYIEDGKKFCQRGHEQTGFTQTQQDEDDWNVQGKKSRKQKQDRDTESRTLRGTDARELYLQCLQLILWKQLHWIITTKHYPNELETIVRDLWGLRLGFVHRSQVDRSGYSSGTMTAIFSSMSEGENTETDESGFRSVSSRKSSRSAKQDDWGKVPKLIETLVIIYLGMLLLRLPISLGEIVGWVSNEEILFNRAIKEIPLDMKIRLPPSLATSLEVRAPLNGVKLQQTVQSLLRFFRREFDLIFPSLNAPLLLYKHITNLGLPVEIFPTVRRLSSLLSLDFTFEAANLTGSDAPEIQLIGLIIIATKLCQPFGITKRSPVSGEDLDTTQINWKEWNTIMKSRASTGLTKEEAMRLQDVDVPGLTGKSMDEYMEWYRHTWLDAKDVKMPNAILNTFPLTDASTMSAVPGHDVQQLDRLRDVHHRMAIKTSDFDMNGMFRKGGDYRRYRTVNDIPVEAQLFFQLAAVHASTSIEVLTQRVYQLEGRIMQWNVDERRPSSNGHG